MTTVEEQPIATTPAPVAENNARRVRPRILREGARRRHRRAAGRRRPRRRLHRSSASRTASFFTDRNFANLFQQGAQVTIIAMGLVFVLLLGEIDLSAGFTSGVCATIMAVLLTQHGWPWYWSVLAAIGVGLVIGLFLGSLVAKLGIPSFIVTLAAFLGLQGVQLLFLSGGNSDHHPQQHDPRDRQQQHADVAGLGALRRLRRRLCRSPRDALGRPSSPWPRSRAVVRHGGACAGRSP